MSVQADSIPKDMWSLVANFSDPETCNSLSQVCRESRLAVHEFASEKIEELKQYPKTQWGGKRLHYLVNQTGRFSPVRSLTLIFNEVRRCGQIENCITFNDIEYSVAEAGKNQALPLFEIFTQIARENPIARQLFDDGKFQSLMKSPLSPLDDTDLENLLEISDWMENNQAILDTIESIWVTFNEINRVNLPHEMMLLRNFKQLTIDNKAGYPYASYPNPDAVYNSIPIEIQKSKISITWTGEKINIDPKARGDYALHVYNTKIKNLRYATLFVNFGNYLFRRVGFICGVAILALTSIISIPASVVNYVYLRLKAYIEFKRNEPKSPLPF